MAVERKTRTRKGKAPKGFNDATEELALFEDSLLGTPTKTELDDGDIEYDFSPEEPLPDDFDGIPDDEVDHYANLAEEIDEDILETLGRECIDRYKSDQDSRREHVQTVKQGLNLLGAKLEETDDPFPGACSAHHPLILESAVKFQAKAAQELFNAKGPVKTAIIGKQTPEKDAQSKRVREHMNWQIMFQMEEYFDEMENMLFNLPIMGSAFKKTYYDATRDRPVSEFIPLDDFVVAYSATNLKNVYCYTHVIRRNANDTLKDMLSGLYREVDLGQPQSIELNEIGETVDELTGSSPSNRDEAHTLLEQYTYLTLEGTKFEDPDGVALPYVITVDEASQKVLSIRRNWRINDLKKERDVIFTHYKFVPGFGFYGLGYIHLLGNLQMTLTSAMRSLVDSGQFANLQAGFVDKRLRMRNNDGPFAPGEFRDVEAAGINIDQAIKLIPFKEPSQTLLAMYQQIEARGQKFADSAEQVIADSTNYGPVGTTMALLEASTKFFSGVHKRLHKSQKQEFKILANINYDYLDDMEIFDAPGGTFEVQREDYDGRIDVIPVSDPNMSSQAQKMTVSSAVYTAALQNPTIHDMYQVTREYYISMGIDEEKVDLFLPKAQEPEPMDPLSDLIAVQQNKPIKAFPGQDHNAHITVKTAFLQDPQSGGNPMIQALIPMIQANIQEHVILRFREQVSGQIALDGSDPEIQGQQAENEQIVAQAAQKLAANNQRLTELEEKGVDSVKTKLADAALLSANTEAQKAKADIINDRVDNMVKAFNTQLEAIKEQNKLLIAGINAEATNQKQQMQEISKLVQKLFDSEMQRENTSAQMQMAEKKEAGQKKEKPPVDSKK